MTKMRSVLVILWDSLYQRIVIVWHNSWSIFLGLFWRVSYSSTTLGLPGVDGKLAFPRHEARKSLGLFFFASTVTTLQLFLGWSRSTKLAPCFYGAAGPRRWQSNRRWSAPWCPAKPLSGVAVAACSPASNRSAGHPRSNPVPPNRTCHPLPQGPPAL